MRIPWWKWLPVYRWRLVGTAQSADEVPDKLPRNGVILVADSGRAKWLVFDCPCRTGHRIMLNADQKRFPFWTINPAPMLTLSPSIDSREKHRRCHFFIRNGRITWATGV